MKAFFKELFRYHYAKHQQLSLHPAIHQDEELLKNLSHLLNAEQVWLSRVHGVAPDNVNVWENNSSGDFTKPFEQLQYDWNIYLDSVREDEWQKPVHYQNLSGQPFTNALSDILFHVINHGTHHRAQINLLLRQKGFEPVKLDYIFFKR